MPHIVHLTSAHLPDDVRIFHKECRTLARAGYEVSLIAPGASQWVSRQVHLVSVSRATSRRERMTRTILRVLREALNLPGELYHFHDAELIPAGMVLKLLGRRVVYDAHEELAEDILDKPWIPPALRPLVSLGARAMERGAAYLFDGVVASRPALMERFSRGKTALVNNYPILGELTLDQGLPLADRAPICAYVGGLTADRGIREIVAALAQLPVEVPLELHIAGTVAPPELESELRRMPGWERVRLLGWVSRQDVADLLARARFGIAMFLPIANHVRSHPTKLFEYMSAGLPVLATDMPLWRRVVEEAGFGKVVDPRSPRALAAAMQWMTEHPEECARMGQRGLEAVQTEYNWEVESRRLLGLYERILSRGQAPPRAGCGRDSTPEGARRDEPCVG